MAQGDRSLSGVIEAAFRAGARFDGWSETFDPAVWRAAFEAAGVRPSSFLEERDPDAPLPWDHIDGGPTREFLLAERAKALLGELTPDCRESGCFDCGACAPAGVAPRRGRARHAREACGVGAGADRDLRETRAQGAVGRRQRQQVARPLREGKLGEVRLSSGRHAGGATVARAVRPAGGVHAGLQSAPEALVRSAAAGRIDGARRVLRP